MKTILVPTDFSTLSKAGLSYALGIAKKAGAKVIVVTIVTQVTETTQQGSSMRKLHSNMLATARSDGNKLLSEFKSEIGKMDVSFQPIAGFPVADAIETFAVKNKVSLIVMSSKGATGLKKIIMGSNATSVIDKSSVPVLVVPAKASMKAVEKVVYATDAKDFVKEVKIVASLAGMLGATMEAVHVIPESKKKDTTSAQQLKALSTYPNIHLQVVYGEDVPSGLTTFISEQKGDFVLATFTHKLTFNERMFGKSVTQKLAFHNSVPLLVVNKSNQAR